MGNIFLGLYKKPIFFSVQDILRYALYSTTIASQNKQSSGLS